MTARKELFVEVRSKGTSKLPYCVACIKSSRFILTLQGFLHLKSLIFPSLILSLPIGSIFSSEKKNKQKKFDNLSTSKTQFIIFHSLTIQASSKGAVRCKSDCENEFLH